MAKGKRTKGASVKRFKYSVLGKDYIVECEEVLGWNKTKLYEFSVCGSNDTIKWNFFCFRADQTQAKVDPKVYTMDEALEVAEVHLLHDISEYEQILECLDRFHWNED